MTNFFQAKTCLGKKKTLEDNWSCSEVKKGSISNLNECEIACFEKMSTEHMNTKTPVLKQLLKVS